MSEIVFARTLLFLGNTMPWFMAQKTILFTTTSKKIPAFAFMNFFSKTHFH